MKTATEGLVTLRLPDSRKEVFYNPVMELSRDISVAFLQAVGSDLVVCDLLSGSGARAVRYAREAGAKTVYANDASPAAEKCIMENARINKVADKIIVSRSGANGFLKSYKGRFDFIDIDPFGSPVYFLDEVAKSAKTGSYLAVTATDCGALAGVFPKTCDERYGVSLERTECFKEVGVRNLVGVVAARLAKQKLHVRCLLAHATEHYFRAFLEIAGSGNDFLDKFYHCRACGYCTFKKTLKCGFCNSVVSILGPVWSGTLYDKQLCFDMLDKLKQTYFKTSKEARKILLSVTGELEQPFYYDVHRISEKMSRNTPHTNFLISELRKSGFAATRTQFSDTSIKTDAGMDEIKSLIATSDKQQTMLRKE
ncbi:MAG: tRNA (guanine(10)-N(2))-dimethyltransferase [Candidatus Aenigmarchaeota archaeon]|nr:tRNA (guanine(10)-N(2))-dimethyltransferase [Candidatus Aenigmarchaeota archaeon]